MREEASKYGPVGHLYLDPATPGGFVFVAFSGGAAAAVPVALAFATAQAGRMFNSKGGFFLSCAYQLMLGSMHFLPHANACDLCNQFKSHNTPLPFVPCSYRRDVCATC